MRDKDWLRFIVTAVKTIIRAMILGAAIAGGIGLLIAAAAAFSDPRSMSLDTIGAIAWNYARVGLFGGGIIGLLYGLLAQGSY